MDRLHDALRGASQRAAPACGQPCRRALVVGGGGVLGAALLAAALGGRYARVAALVVAPLASALRGFEALDVRAFDAAAMPLGIDTAFVVYERERRANGRDDAFHRPQPAALVALAVRLREGGVRRLVVVVPHAAALLPQALKEGFASRDEAAVAALGFEQVVFVRAAQDAQALRARPPRGALPRLAAWWLSQLRWMVPPREQPLRAPLLATLVVQMALRLPAAAHGTRVLAPEVLWRAAQADDAQAVLDAWLGLGPAAAKRTHAWR